MSIADTLKRPMMSEYSLCEQVMCYTHHLGSCRRPCHNRDDTRYITISPIFGVIRKPEDPETIRMGMHTRHKLNFEPECVSCKYYDGEWKKENWVRCVEKAIGGGAKERKELRKIFCKKDERLAIRKLLTFFDCNTTIPMRDSLSGVIDYMYPV